MTLAIILLHMFWGVVFFDSCERQRWWSLGVVVCSHLLVSCLVRNTHTETETKYMHTDQDKDRQIETHTHTHTGRKRDTHNKTESETCMQKENKGPQDESRTKTARQKETYSEAHTHGQKNRKTNRAERVSQIHREREMERHTQVPAVSLVLVLRKSSGPLSRFLFQTFVNPQYEGSLIPTYMVVCVMAVWAFFCAGGSMRNLRLCLSCRDKDFLLVNNRQR